MRSSVCECGGGVEGGAEKILSKFHTQCGAPHRGLDSDPEIMT